MRVNAKQLSLCENMSVASKPKLAEIVEIRHNNARKTHLSDHKHHLKSYLAYRLHNKASE